MVSNLAIFVDAGYLYKQGALAAYGSALKRHEVSMNAKEFVDRLTTYVTGQFPNASCSAPIGTTAPKAALPLTSNSAWLHWRT